MGKYFKRVLIVRGLFFAVFILSFVACNKTDHGDEHDAHHHDQHEEEDYERGPHRGRLLGKEDFQIEVTIFEAGIPPQFRVYAYEKSKPLPPSAVTLSIILSRLGGHEDKFSFTSEKDYLKGDKIVEEPHSFDVDVRASYKGKDYFWKYASYEGRTEIGEEAQKEAGIVTATVAAGLIRSKLELNGRIAANEHRIAHIIPRFPGVVKEARKEIGDRVEKGEVLAIIESNQSLQPYEVKSQIAGTVISGHLILGEFVAENQWVYIVADLSEVWIDFRVHSRDFSRVKVGQRIVIKVTEEGAPIEAAVSYIAPYADEKTQTKLLRTVVKNKDGHLYPGMFASAEIYVEERKVPLAVKASALQTFREWNVVFLKQNNIFEIRPLEIGQNDGEWLEVISGIEAGQSYVSENSFIIKADILKAGASHDH